MKDVQNLHGVDIIPILAEHDLFDIFMTRHHLDPFHAVSTPGGIVFILNLARLLHHCGSFETFVRFLKGVKVAKGGGLWVRVRFGKDGRLRIVSDAGENHAFSTTDPQKFLGPDYTRWEFEQLRQECTKFGLNVDDALVYTGRFGKGT